MVKKPLGFAVLFSVTMFVSTAHADRRHYVWTYQYMTMPKRMTELEFYHTTKLRSVDAWEYRIEVEHGITDYFDISLYQIFTQTEASALHWDAFQLRARYRLPERSLLSFDPLLYLEYNRKMRTRLSNKFEAKLILDRTLGKMDISLNPVYELFFAPGVEHEVGLDIGLSWELTKAFSVGIESTSRAEFEEEETELASYFGPTISFASGNFWYALGMGVGITKHSDDARIRLIMGVVL